MERLTDVSELYGLFYKRLFHIGYSITRDRFLAEDVVQETFIKALNKADTLLDEKKVGAWLSVIATRTAIDYTRKERLKNGIPMDQNMLESFDKQMKQNVEEEVETSFLINVVKNSIKKLTLEYQQVMMLKVEYGLKDNEIAHVLKLKPCTVKTRIYRGRKQLKLLFLKYSRL